MSPGDPLTRRGGWFPEPASAGADRESTATGPYLVCLPYAGGTASVYRDWQRELADLGWPGRVVPVLLPGRGPRLHEAAYTAIRPLAEALAQALISRGFTSDYALFGHSMGALLAYEVARALTLAGEREPRHLFVSGSRAPHLYGDRTDHTLSDDALFRLVDDLGGLGPEPSVGSAYFTRRLPALRADLRACDEYRWRPSTPLSCPVTAFSGAGDQLAPESAVEAWRPYTAGSFLRRHLEGGHFFVNGPARSRLLREVRAQLGTPRSGPGDDTRPLLPARNAAWTY